MRIEILVSNIVKQNDIEAVVNSANANLRLGSGVAGAIHSAAGPELENYCEPIAPLALGHAVPDKFLLAALTMPHACCSQIWKFGRSCQAKTTTFYAVWRPHMALCLYGSTTSTMSTAPLVRPLC